MGNSNGLFYQVFGNLELNDLIATHRRTQLNYEQQIRRQERQMAQINRRLRFKRYAWGQPRCEDIFLGGTWVPVAPGKWMYLEPHNPGWGGVHNSKRNWNIDEW